MAPAGGRGPGRSRTRADVIQARLDELGWDVVELGHRAGIDHRQIYRVQSGHQRALSLAVSIRVSEAIGLPIRSFTDLTDEQRRPITPYDVDLGSAA